MNDKLAGEIDEVIDAKLNDAFGQIMHTLMEDVTPAEVEAILRESGSNVADRFKGWWGEY